MNASAVLTFVISGAVHWPAAIVILLAFTVVAVNFVVDVLYAVIDPRLKAHDV